MLNGNAPVEWVVGKYYMRREYLPINIAKHAGESMPFTR